MPVGEATYALEVLLSGDEDLTPQRPANDIDDLIRQMREVAQGLVLDLPVLAVGPPEEVGLVDPVFVGP